MPDNTNALKCGVPELRQGPACQLAMHSQAPFITSTQRMANPKTAKRLVFWGLVNFSLAFFHSS